MTEILISNKMTSKYQLIGYRENTMGFDMLVGTYNNSTMSFNIRARAKGNKNLPFSLNVVRSGYSQMGFIVQPKIFNHLGFTIDVAPHNQMTAYYELIEPPVHKWEDYPVQDSYTLSESPYNSINYGNANSLLVGNNGRGEAKSYVQFDLSSMEENIRIKNAKLRLYYSDLLNNDISLSAVKEEWRELNITYLNAPSQTEFLTNNYTNDTIGRFIEFDVTEIVKRWYLGIPNNGFMLQSSEDAVTIFRSRESRQSPELIIEYFSSEPLNLANRKMKFEIMPRLSNKTQILFDLEVISYYKNSDMGFSVFAHDPEYHYPSNMPFQIIASRDKLQWSLDVRRQTSQTMAFKIDVPDYGINSLPFEIFVPDFEGQSDLGFSITAQKLTHNDLGFEIICNKNYVSKNHNMGFDIFSQGIYKDKANELGFLIVSQRDPKNKSSEIGFSISPRTPHSDDMMFTIESLTDYTGKDGDLGFTIGVRGDGQSNLPWNLNVSRDRIGFKIAVPTPASDNLPFTIDARKFKVNNMLFTIEVGIVEKPIGSYIYIM